MTARIFLSGPMGSGKSTVGRIVAERLDRAFVDLDRAIEEREGASCAAIFAERGESVFRAIEKEVARDVAQESAPIVCALGGGTVVDRDTRALLLASGTIVALEAPVDELLRRIGDLDTRPLLTSRDGDRVSALARVIEERAPAYAEAHAIVGTSGAAPDEIAARVVLAVDEAPILVPLGLESYRALVTLGLAPLRGLVSRTGASSIVLVTDENAAPHAARARAELEGLSIVEVVLGAGEVHKTVASVEQIWDTALAARVDRHALVLAVGGGVVGDVAGFAAASLLRGIGVGHVPTTLLAMVDSAIGGKTGVDRPEGKNLVGAFHQPSFVLADLTALDTLPERELRAGLAEVVKSAWIAGELEVCALERESAALAARDRGALTRAARMSLRVKAGIVARDPLERGVRAHLNLGHTVGHALETASGYTLRHGEAISLGLVAALRVGCGLGDAVPSDLQRMVSLLRALGLPVDVDAHFDRAAALLMNADKKRAGGRIRFVVPGPPGHVRVEALTEAHIEALVCS